jgi:hypothetical protein
VFTDLGRGDTTRLGVRAVSASGDGLVATMTARLAPLPGTPTSVRALRGNRSATVHWSKPTNADRADVTGYVVRKYAATGRLLATRHLGPDARSYRWTRLTNGAHYRLRTGAVSGSFSGPTARTAMVTPATRPRRTVVRSVTVVRPHVIQATWGSPRSSGGSRVTGYVVLALRLGPSGRVVQRLHARHLRAWQHNLAVRVARTGIWTFQVWAVNAVGRGDMSPRAPRVVVR